MEHPSAQSILEIIKAAIACDAGIACIHSLFVKRIPFRKHLVKLMSAIEYLYALKDLLIGQRCFFRKVDENVEVIRHDAPAQQTNAAEDSCAMHQINKTSLLIVIEEERLMRHPRNKVIATVRDHNSLLTRHVRKYIKSRSRPATYALHLMHWGLTPLLIVAKGSTRHSSTIQSTTIAHQQANLAPQPIQEGQGCSHDSHLQQHPKGQREM